MNSLTRTLVLAFALTVGSQAFAARTTTFFHGDGLGSVVAATNESGQVLWRKDYAPFGEQIHDTPVAERTSYTGKPHDDVTGLTYFGGRNFDPELGRFVSIDPVAFTEANAMSFNRYLYVNNNPYKYVDPDGEFLNFVVKFALDVAINVAVNYITTGEMNVGGALKESAMGILNPFPGKALGKLAMHAKKVDKVTPDPRVAAAANKHVDLSSAQRRKHILDSDATGGGHRHGTGKPGKSEFPKDWSDDKIMHEISDVATDPKLKSKVLKGGRTATNGTRDGVDIRVIQEKGGDIVSGYPTNLPRNPP